MLAVAAPAAAQLAVESLEATHASGEKYRFPVIAGDSPAASRINTFLQASELEKLPGRYRHAAFEEVWPEEDSFHGTTRMDYVVGTNAPALLSVTIQRESMGAYPSSSSATYNFDARTGEVITLTTLFSPAGLAQLRERVAQQRLRVLDDFVAGKPVSAGSPDPLRLRSDAGEAEEQRELYRECRSHVAEDDLGYDDLALGESSLTLRREPCAPHVIQALDDLGDFGVTLSYEELRPQLDDHGRCLLLEQRADCRRRRSDLAAGVHHGEIGGRYPITLVLERVDPGGAIQAAYFYDKHAARIPLRATRTDDGGVRLDEVGPPPARFELRLVDGRLEGHWTQDGKPSLEVDLRAAAQRAPDGAASQNAQALVLREQAFALEDAGDAKGAIGVYEKMLQLEPNDVAAMNSIAGSNGKLGDFQQQLAWADRAIARNPRFQPAYINRGNALAALGKPDAARAAYDKAAELDPKDPIAVYSLGVLAEQRKDFASAAELYGKSVALDPKFESGYFNLAMAQANLGHWDDAIAALKKLLELDPNDREAKAMLAHLEDARRRAKAGTR
jgi:predicted TPR repeat methyltransferase